MQSPPKSMQTVLQMLVVPLAIGIATVVISIMAIRTEQNLTDAQLTSAETIADAQIISAEAIADAQRANTEAISESQRVNAEAIAAAERAAANEIAQAQLDAESARAISASAIEAERFQENVLQGYLDRMSDLILQYGLSAGDSDLTVRSVATARTFSVLPQLNGTRKGVVIRFLNSARLIDHEEPIIETNDFDLTDLDLNQTVLVDANLSFADLSGANLSHAFLEHINLASAKLTGVDFTDSYLYGADLSKAVLDGADLTGVYMPLADLRNTATNEQLAQARSIVGSKMMDGSVMTERRWEEFVEQYR